MTSRDSTVGGEQNVSEDVVLRQLDFEIGRLTDATNRSGLTQWTLVAALGGTLWLLGDAVENGNVSPILAFLVFLLLVVLQSFYNNVKAMLLPVRSTQRSGTRFWPAQMLFAGGRFMMIVIAVREFVVVVVSIYVARHFSFWTTWMLAVGYGLTGVLLLLLEFWGRHTQFGAETSKMSPEFLFMLQR